LWSRSQPTARRKQSVIFVVKCLDLTSSFGNNAPVYGIKSTRRLLP
jgi:hypothetical protein